MKITKLSGYNSKKVIDKYFNRLYVFEKKDKKEIK